ncbi:hypothetical protein AVEN_59949-1, partial [Araneus ventricosus]
CENISVHWRLDGDLAEKCKRICTDGSNLLDRVSCGVICLDLENLRINDEASAFTARAVALLEAFERLDHVDEEVHLFTDSGSVLMALNSVKHTHPLIDRIRIQQKQTKFQPVEISGYSQKVNKPNTCSNRLKAHISIEGNELDDSIPKSAILMRKFPNLVSSLKKGSRLDMSQKAMFLLRLMSVVNNTICYGNFFSNQILTVHGCFPVYQNECFGKSPGCDCGLDQGTVSHLVYGCPNFDAIRKEFLPENLLSLALLDLAVNLKAKTGVKTFLALFDQS